MQIDKAPRTSSYFRTKIEVEDVEGQYPHNLSFYEDLPPETLSVSLREFEEFAVARLKLLRTIERINLTSTVKYSNNWVVAISDELRKQKLDQFVILAERRTSDTEEAVLAARKYDHTSHFILRLAFCKTEDLRRWLLTFENEFFRYKYHSCTGVALSQFLKANHFPFSAIPKEEKEELTLRSHLEESSFHANVNSVDFYKIPFLTALDLIRGRKVYLKDGIAYVPHTELPSILCAIFRAKLSRELAATNKLMPELEGDERLTSILEDFDKRYTGDYVPKKGKDGITVEMLPMLSKKSFPLCMKKLYDQVGSEHHLKHWGRLQLGLFLKGIGVPLDESIRYWRKEFTKYPGVDAMRFDKQYLYNIRHSYGQEGKRADYTPYSCMRIIMQSAPGPGDHHGCPFRHSDKIHLRSKLTEAEIPNQGIKEICDLVDASHYQIACQKYYEYTHKKATVEGGVSHPNQYFEESQRNLSGDVKPVIAKIETNTQKMYAEPRSSSSSKSEANTSLNTSITLPYEEKDSFSAKLYDKMENLDDAAIASVLDDILNEEEEEAMELDSEEKAPEETA